MGKNQDMTILIKKWDFLCQKQNRRFDRSLQITNLYSVADIYSMLRESLKDILQKLMEAELDASLGYEKNHNGEVLTSNKKWPLSQDIKEPIRGIPN